MPMISKIIAFHLLLSLLFIGSLGGCSTEDSCSGADCNATNDSETVWDSGNELPDTSADTDSTQSEIGDSDSETCTPKTCFVQQDSAVDTQTDSMGADSDSNTGELDSEDETRTDSSSDTGVTSDTDTCTGMNCPTPLDTASETTADTLAMEILYVDVRTEQEYQSEHYPGAVNIPLSQLGDRMDELYPLDQPIIVYCASGNRAGQAKTLLDAAGFTNVTNGGSLSNVLNQ